MTEIDRVIIPEERDMAEFMVDPDHRIQLVSKEQSFDTLRIEDGEFLWKNHNRDHIETQKAVCNCGQEFEDIPEAKEHLAEAEKRGYATTSEIRVLRI